jgi:hypothetical protein
MHFITFHKDVILKPGFLMHLFSKSFFWSFLGNLLKLHLSICFYIQGLDDNMSAQMFVAQLAFQIMRSRSLMEYFIKQIASFALPIGTIKIECVQRLALK